jgi:hypothetical protein
MVARWVRNGGHRPQPPGIGRHAVPWHLGEAAAERVQEILTGATAELMEGVM